MRWTLLSSGKSGKREIAISLLMMWAFITCYCFFWVPSKIFHDDYSDPWGTLTWAVLAWAAAAFGIDFAIKQGVFGGTKPAPPHSSAPGARVSTTREID